VASRGYAAVLDELTPIGSGPGGLSLDTVCEGCGRLFDLDGSSIQLIDTAGDVAGLRTWGDLAAAVEAQQFVLGEGPGVLAASGDRPELVPDVATERRYGSFTAQALVLGLGAVFAFPLAIGVIRVGVLSMFRRRAGDLDHGDYGDALLAADIVTMLLLTDQAEVGFGGISWAMDDLLQHQAVVHQATGMVAAQLGCPMEHALLRLRAYAFAQGLGIDGAAELVVRRRIDFRPERTGES
jgi:hypothetical protein